MIRSAALALILLAGPVTAEPEATSAYGAPGSTRSLLVRGTTDIALFGPVLDLFVRSHPELHVSYEQWASNDLYERAVLGCEGKAPAADLLISSSVDQMVKLVNDGCARPHRSVATAQLEDGLNWRDEVFGITREPAVIVYNRRLVPPAEAPRTRFDLIDLLRPGGSPYAERVATYDIEESGLGYLFAFADSLQATTFGSLLEGFGRSGAVATCCSAEIIDGVARGDFAIAYNVLGSYALARAETNPDLVVVAPRDYTLLLARAAMIPSTAPNADDAGALVDFLLSDDGKRVLADNHLIVLDEEGGLLQSGDQDVTLRHIPLSPTLLIGLDPAKRHSFLTLWRTTFPRQ